MRYWQRRPFFFTDTDNTAPLSWTAAVNTTLGTTIQYKSVSFNPGQVYNMVALNAGLTGSVAPNFESILGTVFTVPAMTGNPPPLPPPASGTAGTINDNGGAPTGVIWANNGPITGGFAANTQITTVYNVNQYTPPIDLIEWTRLEVTWQGTIRFEMQPLSYQQLRDYDVIRPTPPTTYPTFYCIYQSLIYLWPYPVGLYPITLSYRSAPTIAQQATDSNIWTSQAEALIRHYAEGRICEAVIGDQAMSQFYYDLAQKEFLVLQQQTSAQDVRAGVPGDIW